jgi:hypothetical protein
MGNVDYNHLFWGYVDDQGKIEVKRYSSDRQIRNYEQMPFVKGIFDPFKARDILQAKMMIMARYQMENNRYSK